MSPGAWMAMVVIGGLASSAVVWSYLHALGADRDVEHARAMALAVLLGASAGITAGLTKLRRATARWLVVGTLVSLMVLVQSPATSALLGLRPLHVADGALVFMAFASLGMLSLGLASRSKMHVRRDQPRKVSGGRP